VIATAGWKHGMDEPTNRAMECIARHIHVYTHYARFSEVLPAMDFAERNNWLPRVDESEIYDFDEIPRLVADYAAGQTSYYPIYRVNAS